MVIAHCRPTVAEIDLPACVRNFRRVREWATGKDVWAVVKADAYGHGAVPVARALGGEAVTGFCVATATEGRSLRQSGIAHPILVMPGVASGGDEDAAGIVVEYGLAAAVQDRDGATLLAEAGSRLGVGPVSVHLKLDTGMSRLGALPGEALEMARLIDDEPTLSLDGVFSNLATGDSVDPADEGFGRVARQVDAFERVCTDLQRHGLHVRHRHLANSAGILHHRRTWESASITGVRPGIALYGASLTAGADPVELEPVMRLRTSIVAVRRLPEKVWVGYGSTVRLRRPSRIAVLPLGYHDGWPRALGNRAEVLVRGRRAPVIGRLSMDVTLVDVTDISAAQPGDTAWLLGGPATGVTAAGTDPSGRGDRARASPRGRDRQPVRVEEVARWSDSIPHEVLSRIGPRIPRVLVAAPHDERPPSGDAASSPRVP